jgi:transcription-repair coupling factor (superfamily II helicase)
MSLKDNTLRCYFINRPESPYFESGIFSRIIQYLQVQTNKARLKQTGKMFMLIADKLKTMEEMHSFLSNLHRYCLTEATVPV